MAATPMPIIMTVTARSPITATSMGEEVAIGRNRITTVAASETKGTATPIAALGEGRRLRIPSTPRSIAADRPWNHHAADKPAGLRRENPSGGPQ